MSGQPLDRAEARLRALQAAHDNGATIAEVLPFGYTTRELFDVGYTPVEFKAAGRDAERLAAEGMACIVLLRAAWPAHEVEAAYGEDAVAAALSEAWQNHQLLDRSGKKSKLSAERRDLVRVSVSALRRAGFTVGDLKQAGFTASALKVQGGWWAAEEQELVDALYSPEELDQELVRRAEANQVDIVEIQKKRDVFLEAAAQMYSHRAHKRAIKKKAQSKGFSGKTLKKLRKDLEKWQEKVARWKNAEKKAKAEDVLRKNLAYVDQLLEQKEAGQAAYEQAKKQLLDLIKKRKAYAQDQAKVIGAKIKPLLAQLADARFARAREVLNINSDLMRRCYPLYRLSTDVRRGALGMRALTIGDPERVDVQQVTHPSRDVSVAEAADRRSLPLEDIVVLDRKIEQLSWSVEEFEAETEMLDETYKLVDRSKAIWTFVDKIERWHPRLLRLANSVTTVTRASQALKKVGHKVAPRLISEGKWTKRKRITGKREFALEFGLSAGASVGIADVMAGLSIAFSGNLRVDDDRRMRANLTIKLIPNFKAEIKGGAGALCEASAKFGFTISNQTYAFVDEKHFAYYVAFRLANLLRFSDKFTRYGNAALHQHIAVYDDEIKKLLQSIVGQAKMQEMEFYLTSRQVWKVHTPAKGKFIPSTDLGFSEAILGGEVSVKHDYTLSVMQRQRLLMPARVASEEPPGRQPSSGSAPPSGPTSDGSLHDPAPPEQAVYQGPAYWEVRARGDGHCAYNSFAYLLSHYGVDGNPAGQAPSVQQLRDVAVQRWRALYDSAQARGRRYRQEWQPLLQDAQQAHDDPWLETEEGRFWSLDPDYDSPDEFVQIQQAGRDPQDRRRHWANQQILSALAEHYGITLMIHLDRSVRVVPFGRQDRVDPVFHVVLRGFSHYNALIPRDAAEAPTVPQALGSRMVGVEQQPAPFHDEAVEVEAEDQAEQNPGAARQQGGPGSSGGSGGAPGSQGSTSGSEGSGSGRASSSEQAARSSIPPMPGLERQDGTAHDPTAEQQSSESGSGGSRDPLLDVVNDEPLPSPPALIRPLPPLPNEARPQLHPSLAAQRRRQDWLDRRNAPRLVTDIRHGKSWGLAFGISLKTFLNTNVDVTITKIVRNNNPDNDGFYLNLKLTGSLFSRTAEKSFLTSEEKFEFPGTEDWPDSVFREDDEDTSSLVDSEESKDMQDARDTGELLQTDPEKIVVGAIVDKIPDDTKEKFADVAKQIGKVSKAVVEKALQEIWQELPDKLQSQLTALANSVQNIGVGVSIDRAKRSLELNYIAVGKVPRLQYIRWTYYSGAGVKGSVEVPVYGPAAVGVSGEASVGKTVALNERLGRNTLSYVLTVFNGLKQRIDGRQQWREFLAEHSNSMRKIYRRVGGKPDSVTARDAKSFERDVLTNTAHWSDYADWCVGPERAAVNFVTACQQAAQAGHLDNVWNRRAPGSRFRTLNPAGVNTLQTLHDKFTTLLWRYGQVQKRDNERKYPFKQKTVYLRPPAGKITFEVIYRYGRLQVRRPPILDFRGDGEYYSSVVDILKNKDLAEAENILPFYENGFEVELEIVGLGPRAVRERLPAGHEEVLDLRSKRPATIRFSTRQPNGEDDLKKAIMDLVCRATKKRTATAAWAETDLNNLDVLTDLLRIDPDLHARFRPWISALWRDKHTYPTAELPLRPENRDDLGVAWGDDLESGDTRADWIRKAHQLFDDWVDYEIGAGHIDPNGNRARDAFEFVLTQIEGPFPGFDTRTGFWKSLFRRSPDHGA